MTTIKKMLSIIGGAAFCCFYPLVTFGSGPANSDDRNLYFGIGPSYQIENFEHDQGQVDIDNAVGICGNIGFRIHQYISFDLQVDLTGWFENHWEYDRYNTTNSYNTRYILTTGNFNGLFRSGRWEPSVALGLGVSRSQVSFLGSTYDDDFELVYRAGLGVAYRLLANFGLKVSFSGIAHWDEEPSIDFYSIGMGAVFWLGPQVK